MQNQDKIHLPNFFFFGGGEYRVIEKLVEFNGFLSVFLIKF